VLLKERKTPSNPLSSDMSHNLGAIKSTGRAGMFADTALLTGQQGALLLRCLLMEGRLLD